MAHRGGGPVVRAGSKGERCTDGEHAVEMRRNKTRTHYPNEYTGDGDNRAHGWGVVSESCDLELSVGSIAVRREDSVGKGWGTAGRVCATRRVSVSVKQV